MCACEHACGRAGCVRACVLSCVRACLRYVRACMRVRACLRGCMRTQICMHVRVCQYVRVCTCASAICSCARVRVRAAYVHVCVGACACACARVCTSVSLCVQGDVHVRECSNIVEGGNVPRRLRPSAATPRVPKRTWGGASGRHVMAHKPSHARTSRRSALSGAHASDESNEVAFDLRSAFQGAPKYVSETVDSAMLEGLTTTLATTREQLWLTI